MLLLLVWCDGGSLSGVNRPQLWLSQGCITAAPDCGRSTRGTARNGAIMKIATLGAISGQQSF